MMENSSVQKPEPEEGEEIIVWKRRWLVLALFMFYGFSNQLQYVAYVTIVDQTKGYFDVNSFEVNMLPAIYPVLYVIFVFPACKLQGKLGLRRGLLVGAGSNALGSILKVVAVLVWPSYWMLVIANFFNGMAQLLFLGLPPMVASVWFPVQERALATALGVLTGFIGMATGLFYSPRIMDDFDCGETTLIPYTHDSHKPEKCTHGFLVLFISQAVLCSVPFLMIAIFVKSAPPTPPSTTANTGNEEIPSAIAVLKRLFKNKWFMLASQCFGSVVGLFTALATVLTQMLKPLGFSESQSAYLAFAGIMAGAFSCALVAPVVDKHRKYKKPWLMLLSTVLLLTSLTAVAAYVFEGNNLLIAGFVLIIGIEMSLLPQFPVALDLSVELSYPEPESISGSFMMVSLSFWSIGGTFAFSAILGNNPTKDESKHLLMVMVGVVCCSILGVVLLKEDLKRLNHEKGETEVDNALIQGKAETYGASSVEA